MCQAKPGPRCSNHALKDKVAARASMDEAVKKYNDFVRDPNVDSASPEGMTRVDELMGEISQATNLYQRRSRDYDSTPEGIKELTAQRDKLIADEAHYAVVDDSIRRLDAAEKLRDRRKQAASFVEQMKKDGEYEASKTRDEDFKTGAAMVSEGVENGTFPSNPELQVERLAQFVEKERGRYEFAIDRISRSVETSTPTRLEFRSVRKAHTNVIRAQNVVEGAYSTLPLPDIEDVRNGPLPDIDIPTKETKKA